MKELHCATAYEWIVRDLDEGLEPEKLRILDRHIQSCPGCRRTKEEIEALLSRLPADTPAEPDEEFWTRYHSSLAARLQEKALSRRSLWGFRWKAAAVAVSAALVAMIAVEATFQTKSPQNWSQSATYPAVIQELTDFYGPVADEMANGTSSTDHTLITVDSRTLSPSYDLMTWFDFDDETNSYLF
jgi:hypothetical protein